MEKVELAVIGGSGFYSWPELENSDSLSLVTPFGSPSERIVIGELAGKKCAFLARHGLGHRLNPAEVNYRANLFAMKMLGAKTLISVVAVGSLKEEIHPTDLVIPDQYVDNTFKREKTFFADGITAHVSLAQPTCPRYTAQAHKTALQMELRVHNGGTYFNMEGPQFSSLAESLLYRQFGFSVIGMTQGVEAKLARELEMCFLPLAFVTDYDCWHQGAEVVSTEMIIRNLQLTVNSAKKMILEISSSLPIGQCDCGNALAGAIVTDPDCIPEETRRKLALVISRYL